MSWNPPAVGQVDWAPPLDDSLDYLKTVTDRVRSVDEFGAVGDGNTDDTSAIQDALDAIGELGGGLLIFTAGKTYRMNSYASISANTHIFGPGATISKVNGGYAAFAALSGSTPGYGAAPGNLRFTGLTLVGNLAAGNGACLLAGHHSDNIVVDQCRFIQCCITGHVLDLCGCRHVTVKDCVFAGQAVTSTPREAIQIDQSGEGSVSVLDGSGSYDGLPTVDVKVTRCRFLKLTVGGTTYPAPVAFGCHTAPSSGQPYTDLTFSDNYCEATQSNTTGYFGVVHLFASRRVRITGNTFIGDGVADTPFIGFFDWSAGNNVSVVIDGNSFTGSTPTIEPLHLSYITSLKFTNNTGSGVFAVGGNKYAVYAYQSARILLADNDFSGNSDAGSTGFYIGSTNNRGSVHDNIVTSYGTNINNAASASKVVDHDNVVL